MLKNVKVKFVNGLGELNVYKGESLLVKTFHEKKGKVFFIEDTYTNKEYIGMGMKKDGDFYECIPIWVLADENGCVKEMKTLQEACDDLIEGAYFAYWKDLFKAFVSEIAGKVEYDIDTLMSLLEEIIKNYPGHTYCYTDENNTSFSFQVLDQFEFIGKFKVEKNSGAVIISNIELRDRYEKISIAKMPNVQANKVIELNEESEETIEDLLFKFFYNLTRYEMSDYILSSILKFDFK